MSSALRSFSQIPVRSKFLVAIAADVSGATASECSAITLNAAWPYDIGTIVAAADVDAAGTQVDYAAGDLFRDLGRQIMIVDDMGAHVALYREAMPQANAEAEGIATIGGSVWLRVWAANGVGAHVARLG
jgi:hypothetical protein